MMEYKVIKLHLSTKKSEEILNNHAKNGWELISTERVTYNGIDKEVTGIQAILGRFKDKNIING